VQNTVGKLIEDKTPNEVSEIKIVDPACGSGSFLIGAYHYLLDWHKNYYSKNGKPSKGTKDQPLTPDGNLTTSEKKRILLNNIFGVDIDLNAVEVTKLSLLLKCLEGETEASIDSQLRLFNDRVLPTLDDNIKSGNSLVDNDFYDNKLDFGEERKIKPFNWQKAFPQVFNRNVPSPEKDQLKSLARKAKHHAAKAWEYAGELESKIDIVSEAVAGYGNKTGFDVVIGNPPYVRMQTIDKIQSNYFKMHFKAATHGNYDLYVLFIEIALKLLSKNGIGGMILPHKFFRAEYGQGIREVLSSGKHINQINDFTTNQVFENATTYTCLLFTTRSPNTHFYYQKNELGCNLSESLFTSDLERISSEKLLGKWNFSSTVKEAVLLKVQKQKITLKDICRRIFKGSSTGNDDIYLLNMVKRHENHSILFSSFLNENIEIENELLKPFIYGSDVRNFFINKSGIQLLFPYIIGERATLIEIKQLKSDYPLTASYFEKVKKALSKRKLIFKSADYYKFSAARSLTEYNNQKILIPDMLVRSRLGIDNAGQYYHGPAIHSIILKKDFEFLTLKYLAALLSSKIFWFFVSNTSTALRGNAYRLTPDYIKPFPIRIIDKEDENEIQHQTEIIRLIDLILQLNEEKDKTKLQSKILQIDEKIEYCENRINQIVYQLYDLTEEEILIVEGKSQGEMT
jgi:adenine-specific DNA-methyltransferase